MNESQFLTSDKRMDVISALLFLAACPFLCMGYGLRNCDTLSLSVEAAVTFQVTPLRNFARRKLCPSGA
jgi:hypothetical protein